MSNFSCLAKVPFYLSTDLVNKIIESESISFDQNNPASERNPIYCQLSKLIRLGIYGNKVVTLKDPDTNSTLEVDANLLKRLKERWEGIQKDWKVEFTPFREQPIPADLKAQVVANLPKELQDLNPRVVIQSTAGKNGILAPHIDHYRNTSLFYLVKGNQEETMWWEKSEDFEEFEYFRFADVTKIRKLRSEIIQERQWYVFDQDTYHSVHPTGPVGRRTAICIEFDNISAEELYNIVLANPSAELLAREELSTIYAALNYYGWDDLIYTHASVRIPGTNKFLINEFGLMFSEVTADNLIAVDIDDESDLINSAGFTIHNAIYKARPDVNAIVHIHTPEGVAVSASKDGLLPISQPASSVLQSLSYHDYQGLAVDSAEEKSLQDDLSDTAHMILRHHGLLTASVSAQHAFLNMYNLQRACEIQVLTDTSNCTFIDSQVLADVGDKIVKFNKNNSHRDLAWAALKRVTRNV